MDEAELVRGEEVAAPVHPGPRVALSGPAVSSGAGMGSSAPRRRRLRCSCCSDGAGAGCTLAAAREGLRRHIEQSKRWSRSCCSA